MAVLPFWEDVESAADTQDRATTLTASLSAPERRNSYRWPMHGLRESMTSFASTRLGSTSNYGMLSCTPSSKEPGRLTRKWNMSGTYFAHSGYLATFHGSIQRRFRSSSGGTGRRQGWNSFTGWQIRINLGPPTTLHDMVSNTTHPASLSHPVP
jgi:hypothetical protein